MNDNFSDSQMVRKRVVPTRGGVVAAQHKRAAEGPRAVYGGDVGAALAKDVQAKGGCLAVSDLEAYRAHIAEPIEIPYHGGRIFAAPGMTGGPESCTTHFSVADRHGNLCAVTQTLLSIFGSRVLSPSTGALLNNGIMWFDPEPGKPNSPKGERFALGASGGRKIVGTVLQISSFLIDDGASLEDAFHRPPAAVSLSLRGACGRAALGRAKHGLHRDPVAVGGCGRREKFKRIVEIW